ncbi:MAG: PDZ domain-containing protein [Pyrinomonadaceae bacterium]
MNTGGHMFSKSFAFIVLFALTGITILAQDAPEPPKPKSPDAPSVMRAYSIAADGLRGGSYVGIYMQEVTGDNFSKFGLSSVRGVAVTKVAKDSPAEKAGIKDGDVVVRFNGENVTSVRKLTRLISEVAPDHSAKITVVRGGSERDFDVKIGKRENVFFRSSGNGTGVFSFPEMPAIQGIPGGVTIQRMPKAPGSIRVAPSVPGFGTATGNALFRISSRTIGVNVTQLTDQLGDYFGISDGKGLLVSSVGKDSPAEKAGLKAGDVITEIDGKKVERTYDMIHSLGLKNEGDVTLTVVRDKKSRTVKVTPDKSKGGSFVFDGGNFEFKTKSDNDDDDEN